MNSNNLDFKIVIDFDSTFCKLESLDELAKISLYNNPRKMHILKKIKKITSLGMEGKIMFNDSLNQKPHRRAVGYDVS